MNNEYVKPMAEIIVFDIEDELTIIDGTIGISGKESDWM